MYWLIISSVVAGLSGLVAYIYFMKKGQFDDAEDVKYQMFRDED